MRHTTLAKHFHAPQLRHALTHKRHRVLHLPKGIRLELRDLPPRKQRLLHHVTPVTPAAA